MAEDNWYFAAAGQQHGPVSFEALRDKAQAGEVRGDDLVWTEGMPEWSPASTVAALGVAVGGGGGGAQYDVAAASAPAADGPQQQPAYSPYAAPPGVIGYGTYAYQTQVVYAGFWLRFCAAVIDAIITAVPGFILGAIVGFLAASSNTSGQPTAVDAGLNILLNVVSIVIGWLYGAMFESSSYQATPGKMALGIRVSDMNGQRISFGRATGRHFAKIISAIICAIGYIMAAFTERKQALHDQMAGTLVVMKQG